MHKAVVGQIIFVLFLLAGCSLGPHYTPPCMDIPCQWHSPPSVGMTSSSPQCFLWWEALNDPTLNCLIQKAAHQNLDLHIAATRILEARAERKGKSADLYPHVDASATAGHLYYSKDALVNGILSSALSPAERNSVKRNVNFFELGFDADWEIDLFGVTEHEIKALKAKIEASEENLSDIWITLSAEVARNYIELRGFQQRLELMNKNICIQKDSIHLTKELVNIGTANTIDLRQAEEQLNILSAQRPLIQLSIDKAIHRISILLGYTPGELFCTLSQPSCLPCIPICKPIGVPSELLRRRPDIRKAERELAAATELIASAVASLFPRLSLQGFIGDISTQLHSLITAGSFTWFAAPQILMPIFNSRLIQQDIDLNKIKTRQALYEYQKTVLEALEETENAIASFHYELNRNCYLSQAQKDGVDAYTLTMQLYQKGLKDYLEVLVTNRSLLSTEDSYIQSQVDLLLHYIALYKSLGGGWETCHRE